VAGSVNSTTDRSVFQRGEFTASYCVDYVCCFILFHSLDVVWGQKQPSFSDKWNAAPRLCYRCVQRLAKTFTPAVFQGVTKILLDCISGHHFGDISLQWRKSSCLNALINLLLGQKIDISWAFLLRKVPEKRNRVKPRVHVTFYTIVQRVLGSESMFLISQPACIFRYPMCRLKYFAFILICSTCALFNK